MNKIETSRLTLRVQEKCGFRYRFADAEKNWGMTDECRPVVMRYLGNETKTNHLLHQEKPI